MAKLKITNLRQVQTALRKKMITALRQKELRDEIGASYVEEIQKVKFPVTSEKTKAMRKYLEKKNTTSPKYNPNTINVTFTGELLQDLKNNVKAKTTGSLAVFEIAQSSKKHKKYKKPNGKVTKGNTQTFQQIADHLKKLGYDYLSTKYLPLIEDVKENIIKKVRAALLRALRS